MKKIMLAAFVFAALAVFLYGDSLAAEQQTLTRRRGPVPCRR